MNPIMQYNSNRGSAMVEMAITVPVFLLILFGIMQWSYIFSAAITVRSAAMVGARTAALWNSSIITAQDKARSLIVTLPNYGAASVVCTIAGGVDYTCSIDYPLPLFAKFVVPGATGGTFTISASSTMH